MPFLRNSIDFSFDSELLMQASHFGFRIVEVPARTRYFDQASSIGLKPSTVYGIKTLGGGEVDASSQPGAAIPQVLAVSSAVWPPSGPGSRATG